MKTAKREHNQIVECEKVSNITALDNSTLIILERGDKIKKHVTKKTRIAFGIKGLYSVKELKEAVRLASVKESEKKAVKGCWCMVCCEVWTTAADGLCCDCHIS